MLDVGLFVFYALFAIAILAAVLFPIINSIKTPAALLRSLIGVGALLVVFGIAYALSDSEVSQGSGLSAGQSRLIGAGLIVFYIALIVSAAAVLYSEITKAFK